MATQNVIEILIRSLVDGDDKIAQYRQKLDQLVGSTDKSGAALADFSKQVDDLERTLTSRGTRGAQVWEAAIQKVVAATERGITSQQEFNKFVREFDPKPSFGPGGRPSGGLLPEEFVALDVLKAAATASDALSRSLQPVSQQLADIGKASGESAVEIEAFNRFTRDLTSALTQGIQAISSSNGQLGEFGDESTRVAAVVEQLRQNLDRFDESLQRSSIDKTSELYERYQETIRQARAELEEFAAAHVRAQQETGGGLTEDVVPLDSLKAATAASDGLAQSLQPVAEQLADVGKASNLSASEVEQFNRFVVQLSNALNQSLQVFQDSEGEFDQLGDQSVKVTAVIEQLRQTLDRFEDSLQRSSIDKTSALYQRYQETIRQARTELEQFAAAQTLAARAPAPSSLGFTGQAAQLVSRIVRPEDRAEVQSSFSDLGKSVAQQFLEAAGETLVAQPLAKLLNTWVEKAGPFGPVVADIQKAVTPVLQSALTNIAKDVPEVGVAGAIKKAITLPVSDQTAVKSSFSDLGKDVAQVFIEEAAKKFIEQPARNMLNGWIERSGFGQHGLGGAIFGGVKKFFGFGGAPEPPPLPPRQPRMSEAEIESLISINQAERALIQTNSAYAESIRSINEASAKHAAQTQTTASTVDVLKNAWARAGAAIVVFNQGMEAVDRVLGPIIRALDNAAKEAAQMQTTLVGLQATFDAFGRKIPVENLVRFAEGVQKSTGVADNATLNVTRLLASMTDLNEEGLKQATEGVIALSEVFGRDLNTSAFQVATLLEGLTNRVRGTSIAIDEDTRKVDRLAAVMEQLGPLYVIATSSTNTFEKEQRKLNSAVADFNRALGEPVIKLRQQLTPTMRQVVEAGTALVKEFPAIGIAAEALSSSLNILANVAIAGIAIKIAGLDSALLAAGKSLIAFAAHPVTLGIALLGATVAIDKMRKGLDDLAASKGGEEAAKRIADINRELEHLKKFAPGDIGGIKNLEDRIKKIQTGQTKVEIDPQTKEAFDTLIKSAGNAGVVVDRAFRDADRALKKFVKEGNFELEKMQADTAAAAAKAQHDITGSQAALAASFEAQRRAVRATFTKEFDERKLQLEKEHNLDDKRLTDEVANFKKSIEARRDEQLKLIDIQERTARQQAGLETQQLQIGSLKEIAAAAESQVGIERDRLEILQQQGASLEQQVTQLSKLSITQKVAVDATLANLNAEKLLIQTRIASGKVLDNERKAAENRLKAIDAEIARATAQGANLPAQAERELQSLIQKATQLAKESADSLANAAQARVETERTTLSILEQQNRPLAEQLAQLERVQQAERNFQSLKVIQAADRVAEVQAERDSAEAAGDRQQDVERYTTELRNATTELQRQLNIQRQLGAQQPGQALEKVIGDFQRNQGAGIQAQLVGEESRVRTLNTQLQLLRDQERPYREMIEVARQLDEAERAKLALQIQEQQNVVQISEARQREGKLTEDQVRVERERLAALEASGIAIGRNAEALERQLKSTARSMADQLAGGFANTFIELMQTRELKTVEDFMANMGKTIAAGMLQGMIAKFIEQPLLGMLKQWGEGATQGFSRFGIGGAIIGAIFGEFEEAAQNQTPTAGASAVQSTTTAGTLQASATALASSGTTMSTAGVTLNTAAATLQTAATTLLAAATLMNTKGVEDPISKVVQTFADEANEGVGVASDAVQELGNQAGVAAQTFKQVERVTQNFGAALIEGIFAFGRFIQSLGESGGSGAGGIFGILGSVIGWLTGGAGAGTNAAVAAGGASTLVTGMGYAHGGIVLAPGKVHALARGGMVTRGPVMGIIGEEGDEIIARMKPARSGDMGEAEPKISVIIDGDITPRRPDMKAEDIIRIIVDNGNRTINGGVGGMIRSVIRRSR